MIILIYPTVNGQVDRTFSPTIVGPFEDNLSVEAWLNAVQPTLPNNHFVITSMDNPASFLNLTE